MSAADPQMVALVAQHDGLCPVCCRFIRAGRSHILPADVGMTPDPSETIYDPHDRSWHFGGHRSERLRRYRWLHARCARELHRRYHTSEERIALADEWQAELRALKAKRDAEMVECERRTRGRRQSPRRRSRA